MRINRQSILCALALAAACNSRNPQLAEDSGSTVAITGGLNTSMIYVARTDSGVIAIDLGWWGHEGPMSRALARIGATPGDVKRVFITHSHRDHIGAWRMVRGARFHLAESERPRFLGAAPHRGWLVRWAEALKPAGLPDSTQLEARTFSRDTVFDFGGDTLRAYVVPGHTAGSAIYLFRGVIFMGDAATYLPFRGYRSAKAQFSDDPAAAAANLGALWQRLPLSQIRIICTAHAECAPFTPEIVNALGGDWRP